MSIPERVWRIVKGRVAMAGDQLRSLEEKLAEAEAYQELTEALKHTKPRTEEVPTPTPTGSPVLPKPPTNPASGQVDPMEAAYELLQVRPGAGLAELDAAYQARVSELRIETAPEGSPDRAALEARLAALTAAHDKLRDVLNPTETRFERLEL